ncbi:tRNA (adenosine(37)-N6)-dimethylallyltransferase MiaA [Sediminibacterium sp.]|uniref:tRNA (adenosine(37)-N6)-dimethylallyltransferase MiaA n=1 Tax=Sediminibacterium sp. TaxID=1917865 RepID=UPI0025CE2D72|nr:tRNA (adenosine(37)-N6)-dimethylallyltransferase MiaA [Sediminibacterium sp.]
MSQQHTVILVAGPTAVGKTAVAIQLAKQFETEIISADSRQCYREMDIGVARPSPEELATVPHHFIASHTIKEEVNAGVFEQYALAQTEMLFANHPVVVMTGGTGLYIKAFCEGIDEMPAIPSAIRENIIQLYETNGLQWLQEQVQQKDPIFWQSAEQQNPQRLMRALEFAEATGKSITLFRAGKKAERPFRIIKIGLEMPRELLNERINQRVDVMMKSGLLEEVKTLFPFRRLNALQTVGYQEIFDYLEEKTDLKRAVELIKQHTRQYAKRQMTWFKKDSSIHWVNAAENMEEQIKAILQLYHL